jgi:hypothetical protein
MDKDSKIIEIARRYYSDDLTQTQLEWWLKKLQINEEEMKETYLNHSKKFLREMAFIFVLIISSLTLFLLYF